MKKRDQSEEVVTAEDTEAAEPAKATVVSRPESAYQQIVENMCQIVTSFQSEAVLFYHKLGKNVSEVTGRPDKYGSKSVETLAKSLEMHNVHLKSASLYDAQNIFKTLTPEQLKKVVEAKFSLRRALLLCRKNVTDEMRDEIIDQAHEQKDEPTPYDVQGAIDAKLGTGDGGGEAGGGDAGSSAPEGPEPSDADVVDIGKAARRIKNAVKLIESTTTKLDGLDDCVSLICGGSSAERIKEVFTDFDIVVTAMDELETRWDNQLKSARASFEKVKEILKS